MSESDLQGKSSSDPGPLTTLINVLTSPSEAFSSIRKKPTKLFPLLLVVSLNAATLAWYFSSVDFDWFIDDILSTQDLTDSERVEARENMVSLSVNSFALFGVIGGSAAIIAINILQAGYLSLVAAIRGDSYKFGHWFSLCCWSGLPVLLTIAGSAITILLSPTGQLSAYDLDPFTLKNLGINPDNASVQTLSQSLSLTSFWSLGLIVFGHKQWTEGSWSRSIITVGSPYLCILGIWAVLALN